MKSKKGQPKKGFSFLPNKEEIKMKSVQTLRNSFAVEGIFFTDEEIRTMSESVLGKTPAHL